MKSYTPCCWSNYWKGEKNPRNTLPLEHFTGEDFNRIRKEMLEGKKTEFLEKYCASCWKHEEQFGHSPRLNSFKIHNKDIMNNFNSDGTMIDNDDRFISIGINVFGNYCNLECYECVPINSSSRISTMKKLNDPILNKNFEFVESRDIIEPLDREQFKKIVDELVSLSHKIVNISIVGGEAMLMKSHFILLDRLIECGQSKNITLLYTSNMTLMNLSRMKKYFDNFFETTIQWSVDALKERNHWLRYPTDWDQTVKNVEEVNSYLIKNNMGSVKATVTPSLFSITSFKETADWLTLNDYLPPGHYHVNFVDTPSFLGPQHLPQELKEKIKNDVKMISKNHYNQLMSDRDEDKFKLAIKYADQLDAQRGTNWRSIFPEISQYANE
jgi:organic radical activating enzyme